MKGQALRIPMIIGLAMLASWAMAAETTTIRLANAKSLKNSPVIKYQELFLGPDKELTWPAGNETIEFSLRQPRLIDLQLGDEVLSLYVSPGDQLTLDLDGNGSLKSLQFGNSMADANNRLFLDYQRKFEAVLNPDSVQSRVSNQPQIDQYEFALFDQAKELRDYVKQHPDINAVSPAFKDFISKEARYFYWGRIFAHPVYRSDAGILNIQAIPRVMYENFDPSLVQAGDLASREYQQLLRFYTAFATAERNSFKKFETQEFLLSFQSLCDELLDGETMGYAVTNILLKNGATLPPSGIRSCYNRLQKEPAAAGYTALVGLKLAQRMNAKEEEPKSKKNKAKAKVKHNVEFFDDKGNAVGLEQFAGKVVYVDFWASWCGPCRRQFPYTKEMKSRFSEKELKEIVFLYISIDRDETTWQSAVEKLGLEGEHLFSPGGWKSDACSYFGINSIPRYMILDKEGEIVYPNAPRPSSPETPGILKRLISE